MFDLIEIRYLERVSVFRNKRIRDSAETVHKVFSDNVAIPFTQAGGLVTLSQDHGQDVYFQKSPNCLLYTSPSPRDRQKSRMPSSA